MNMFSSLLSLSLLSASAQAACTSSACLTCSANPNFCLTCNPSYYLQPENVGLCYSYCPTGYIWNAAAKTCDGSPDKVVDFVLNTIGPTFYDTYRSWPAQNGDSATYYYNPTTFEASDPIPSKARGYHFNGSTQYVKILPLAGQPSVIPVVGANGSVFAWIMLDACGSQMCVFGKNDAPPSAANLLYLMIRSSPCTIFFAINNVITYESNVISINTWHNVLLTFQYNPATGSTDMNLYVDLATAKSATSAFKMVDDINGQASIGQEYDSGSVKSDFFKGSIWQVTLYNYAISYATYQAQVLGPGQPASATSTLSTCGFTQYINAGGGCANCLAACTNGCVTGTSCYLCADYMCAYCSSFDAGSCVSCISNAAIVAGVCACSNGYYYVFSSNSCPSCDPTCATCSDAGPAKCTACKSGAQLTAGVNSPCTCSPGYFTLTNSGSCTVCDVTCNTCQGAGGSQCTACKGVATLSGGSVGTCTCPSAYFPSTDSSNCQPCDNTCLTCQGAPASQCKSCKGAAVISSGTVGACVCPSAYFPSTDSSNCVSCDITCLTCQGTSISQCMSCKGVATLSGGPPGTCVCPSTHYPSSDSSNCLVCDNTCLSCQGAGPNLCKSCKGTAAISGGGSVGTCTCPSTNYPSIDSSNCQPCDSTCATCQNSGPSQCLSCIGVATINGSPTGACICPSSYFPSSDSSNCQPCDSTCLTCQNAGASQCTSCHGVAILLAAVGACFCPSTHYPGPDSSSCQLCDVTCLTCQNAGSSQCLSCKSIAVLSSSPGQCACPSTHYGSPDSSNCLICDSSCGTCSGPGVCDSCLTGAGLIAGICACLSTHYPNPDPRNCAQCDPTCLSCQSARPNNCLSCKGVATLQSDHTCLCPSNFKPLPDSRNCVHCHFSCLDCKSSSPSDCTACFSHAYLAVPPVSNCVCEDGYFPSPNSSSCALCDYTCAACEGNSPSQCTECKGAAQIASGRFSGPCTCSAHYFPSPDVSMCMRCHIGCETCSSSGEYGCVSCYSGAELSANSCKCVSGFYPAPDASSCRKCDPLCLECAGGGSTDCTICRLFSKLSSGACLCIDGYHYGEDFSCVPNTVITEYFSGKLISVNTTMTLMFSATLATELQPENISVDLVSSLDEIRNFTWHMQPTVPCNRYSILLTSPSSIPTNSTAILTFHNHTAILSTSKAVLSCTSLDTIIIIPRENSTTVEMSAAAVSAGQAVVSAMAVSALASSVVTGSTGALWQLINTLQILSYIPLSYIPLPPLTRGLLTATNAFSILPSPFFFLPSETAGLPQHAIDFGFSSGLFVANSSQLLVSFVGLLGWLGVVLLLRRIPYLPVQLYAQDKLKMFKWGYFLRFWIESYLPMTIAVGLQGYIILNSAPIDLVSATVAGVFALFLLITPYLFIKNLLALRRNSKLFSSTSGHKAGWEVLIDEFTGVNNLSWVYYPAFCSRRLLYAVTQLYLQDFPIVQAVLNVGHSGVFALFCLLKVEFQVSALKIVTVSSELGVTLLFILVQMFYFDLNSSHKHALEIAILSIMSMMAGISIVITAYLTFVDVRKVVTNAKTLWSQRTRVLNGVNSNCSIVK